MTERISTPYNPRGPHTTGQPPAPAPDRALTQLIWDHLRRNSGPEDIAAALVAAGYRAPVSITQWAQTLDYPPATIFIDTYGTPWSADAVTETEWERRAPWVVVYTPPVPDITTT